MTIIEPTQEAIRAAAAALRQGQLVVLPTETVYGLACNALHPDAVARVFAAKKRPIDNPLIVHLASASQVEDVAAEFPASAQALAEAFWPGPLTLVLRKLPIIPDAVTAGHPTVAVRVPVHPVALAVLREAGVPIAAPSANVFMAISPTSAQDVGDEIARSAACILDGGTTEFGIESTVVDCTQSPTILRPGVISREQIEQVLGLPVGSKSEVGKAPGQYLRHYAPGTPVRLATRLSAEDAGLPLEIALNERQIPMPREPRAYAARLYSALRELDARGYDEIVIERPPDLPDWEAVHDRIRKAAG